MSFIRHYRVICHACRTRIHRNGRFTLKRLFPRLFLSCLFFNLLFWHENAAWVSWDITISASIIDTNWNSRLGEITLICRVFHAALKVLVMTTHWSVSLMASIVNILVVTNHIDRVWPLLIVSCLLLNFLLTVFVKMATGHNSFNIFVIIWVLKI